MISLKKRRTRSWLSSQFSYSIAWAMKASRSSWSAGRPAATTISARQTTCGIADGQRGGAVAAQLGGPPPFEQHRAHGAQRQPDEGQASGAAQQDVERRDVEDVVGEDVAELMGDDHALLAGPELLEQVGGRPRSSAGWDPIVSAFQCSAEVTYRS